MSDENLSEDRWAYARLVGTVKAIAETPEDPIDIWLHEDGSLRCITCDRHLNWDFTPYMATRDHIHEHIKQFGEGGNSEAIFRLERLSYAIKILTNSSYPKHTKVGFPLSAGDHLQIGNSYFRVEDSHDVRVRFKPKQS